VVNIMKKRIFISHIHEEHALGAVVRDWVTDAFIGHPVQPFLSTDDHSIQAGQKWLDVVEHELSGTGVMISLVSRASLTRPWVNIELGAAWITRVPIIPLCHSGLAVSALPRPFGDFHAVGLIQDDAAKRLLGGVADALQLPLSTKLHFAKCLEEMRAAAAKSEKVQAAVSAPVETSELPHEQLAILIVLAESEDSGNDEVPGTTLTFNTGLTATQFKMHIQKLLKANLVYVSHYGDGSSHYRNSPEGAELVERHRQS
jgi:hypothetical protein